MAERKSKPKFTFPGAPQDPFSPERRGETLQRLAIYEAARRDAHQSLGIEVSEVVVTQTDRTPPPLRVLHFSDWHLFSDSSSAKDVLRLEAELAKPALSRFFMGT